MTCTSPRFQSIVKGALHIFFQLIISHNTRVASRVEILVLTDATSCALFAFAAPPTMVADTAPSTRFALTALSVVCAHAAPCTHVALTAAACGCNPSFAAVLLSAKIHVNHLILAHTPLGQLSRAPDYFNTIHFSVNHSARDGDWRVGLGLQPPRNQSPRNLRPWNHRSRWSWSTSALL